MRVLRIGSKLPSGYEVSSCICDVVRGVTEVMFASTLTYAKAK